MTDPASPEGMLRSYHGEDNTGLSAIREKPVDDRSVFQQTRDYLTKGINEDAGDALGPHAAPALIGLGSLLGEIFGPGADVRDAVTASGETTQAVKEGDILGAGVGGLSTLASLVMMALPGSLSGVNRATKEVTDDVASFIPKEFPTLRKDWWLDNNKDTVTLYHGTDVKNLNKIKKEGIAPDASNKTFLTPDADTAVGYASMTGGEKTFRQVGKKAKTNPMENRRLLEIEVPRDVVIANMDKQSSKYSISKLLDPDARGKFKPYDKKENQPYYARTEFSIEGGIPPQYIKGVSSKADPRKTKKKKAGGSVVERNHFNYPPRAI